MYVDTIAGYTLFFKPNGIFTDINHILGHKANLNKWKLLVKFILYSIKIITKWKLITESQVEILYNVVAV